MLTREDVNEIATRYHESEYEDWSKPQAVFDIGRLLGHASDLQSRMMALESEVTRLRNELRAWSFGKTGRVEGER